MFLTEGVPRSVIGVICGWFLTDRPADATWLTAGERAALGTQMDADDPAKQTRFHVSVREPLTRPWVWALAFVYFGVVYGLYALSFFLPTIIKGFEGQCRQHVHPPRARVHQRHPLRPRRRQHDAALVPARGLDQERVWHVALPLIIGGAAIPVTLYPAACSRRWSP